MKMTVEQMLNTFIQLMAQRENEIRWIRWKKYKTIRCHAFSQEESQVNRVVHKWWNCVYNHEWHKKFIEILIARYWRHCDWRRLCTNLRKRFPLDLRESDYNHWIWAGREQGYWVIWLIYARCRVVCAETMKCCVQTFINDFESIVNIFITDQYEVRRGILYLSTCLWTF